MNRRPNRMGDSSPAANESPEVRPTSWAEGFVGELRAQSDWSAAVRHIFRTSLGFLATPLSWLFHGILPFFPFMRVTRRNRLNRPIQEVPPHQEQEQGRQQRKTIPFIPDPLVSSAQIAAERNCFVLVFLDTQRSGTALDVYLSRPELSEYLAQNFVLWASSGENEEGERVGWAFEFQQFPVAIVVSFIDGQSHILNAWRGDLPPDVFFNHLLQVMEENHQILRSSPSASSSSSSSLYPNLNGFDHQQSSTSIIEDQNEELLLAQAMDMSAKEHQYQVKKEEEIRRKKEEEENALAEKKVKEELQQLTHEKEGRRLMLLARLPPEPPEREGIKIGIRMANGSRLFRRFHQTDLIQAIYDFVSLNIEEKSFILFTNFPQKDFQKFSATLLEEGITENAMIEIKLS